MLPWKQHSTGCRWTHADGGLPMVLAVANSDTLDQPSMQLLSHLLYNWFGNSQSWNALHDDT